MNSRRRALHLPESDYGGPPRAWLDDPTWIGDGSYGEQECTWCREKKPIAAFDFNPTKREFKQRCKDCAARAKIELQEQRPSHQEMVRQWSENEELYGRLRASCRIKGITVAEYFAIFARQKYACAICKCGPKGKRALLCIDHDHDSGEVRGLLCNNCNTGIGMLQDSAQMCRSAGRYLARHQAKEHANADAKTRTSQFVLL